MTGKKKAAPGEYQGTAKCIVQRRYYPHGKPTSRPSGDFVWTALADAFARVLPDLPDGTCADILHRRARAVLVRGDAR